jgi:hypothetical protein
MNAAVDCLIFFLRTDFLIIEHMDNTLMSEESKKISVVPKEQCSAEWRRAAPGRLSVPHLILRLKSAHQNEKKAVTYGKYSFPTTQFRNNTIHCQLKCKKEMHTSLDDTLKGINFSITELRVVTTHGARDKPNVVAVEDELILGLLRRQDGDTLEHVHHPHPKEPRDSQDLVVIH